MRYRSTHAQRLERWLGAEHVDCLQANMRDWYGPPIAVACPQASIQVFAGGDIVGPLAGGAFSSLRDLQDKGRYRAKEYAFRKNSGAIFAVDVATSYWARPDIPVAGTSIAPAAPDGEAPVNTTTGAFRIGLPVSGETLHFAGATIYSDIANRTLMLYDRVFHVTKTMNSTATEAVTNQPGRYQSTTASDPDYIGGNFLFTEVGANALSATAHNWTVCQYTNQASTSGVTLPSFAGRASAAPRNFDFAVEAGKWFAPLAAGDTGIKALSQMQCDALVTTGEVNFVIGHPIAFLPAPLADAPGFVLDGITSAFNLARIFDNPPAALALFCMPPPTTQQTQFHGSITLVAG